MKSKFVSYVVMTTFVLVSWVAARGCTQKNKRVKEQVDIVSMTTSPNKEYVATIYTVSGGGAAGYVYKVVNLRKKAERFDPKKGIIFSITGAGEVALSWGDNEHLTIKHSKAGNVYAQAKEWGSEKKIRISYVED